jgi:hypothetical protein
VACTGVIAFGSNNPVREDPIMSTTPAFAPPQSVSWGMPTRFVFAPSRGEALTEAEVAEIAGRLVRAGTEAERDHLLAIALTHAARRAGGELTVPLGTTLGRTLKGLREHEAGNPRDFAAARRLVRLAAEAAREAVLRRASTGRDTAVMALANAASVHAPHLLPALATHRAASAGHWVRKGDGQIVVHLAAAPSRGLESESFEYDPEMDYFLGGLIHSVGRAVGTAAKFVGRAVGSAAHAVGDLSSSVADTLGKIPFIGPGLKGLYGYTYGALIQSVDSAVSGVRLDKVLSRHFENQVKNIKEVAPYVQTIISVVPGIGPGISGAISAGLTLAQGRPIDEALVDAAAGALPGGALAKSMARMAYAAASGKPLSDIAISALPITPAAKDGLKAGLRVASDVAQGKRVDKALLAETNRQIDKLPPVFRTAAQVGVALGQGKKIQDIAVKQLPNLIAPGGPLAAAGQKISLNSPIVRQARGLVAKGQHGFDVAQGLLAHSAVPSHQLERVRNALKGDALKGFDIAVALHKGRVSLPPGRRPAPTRLPFNAPRRRW